MKILKAIPARKTVLRIRIRIHMFLGLPDPDPLVRGMDLDPDPALDPDPDTSIIMKKTGKFRVNNAGFCSNRWH